MEFDKTTEKVLFALYHQTLPDCRYSKLIGWEDMSQPNPIDQLLRQKKLVTVKIIGEPDGAGGYIDESVTKYYSLTPDGRAAAEKLKQDRSDRLLDRLVKIKDLFR